MRPRLWNAFLDARNPVSQVLPDPSAGPPDLYRVVLRTGTTLVGQVREFSNDPDDDVQEILLQFYSVMGTTGELASVPDSDGALIARADILSIERLTTVAVQGLLGPTATAA